MTLWWVMLAGSAAIWVFVMTLLALAFRRSANQERGNEASGIRLWVVKLGLAFPLTGLAALLAYGLWVGERFLPRAGDDRVIVTAEAARWTWRFGYADLSEGRMTENVLHIPAGRPVDVRITTTDVIHSFWVPRLAGKMDAIPGRTNVLRIEADAPGRYAGRSGEFSGPGYLDHSFEVIAHGPEEWAVFLAEFPGEPPQ